MLNPIIEYKSNERKIYWYQFTMSYNIHRRIKLSQTPDKKLQIQCVGVKQLSLTGNR